MSYYLHLSSQDSKVSHPWNSAYDFTVEIPRPFYLDGSWECGLLEIEFPNDIEANTIYFCCDLIEDSYVSDTFHPVLRTVSNKTKTRERRTIFTTFAYPHYVSVKKDTFQRVRIFIRGDNLSPVGSVSESVRCTLHIRKS